MRATRGIEYSAKGRSRRSLVCLGLTSMLMVLLSAGVQAQTFNGRDHPNRTEQNRPPHDNRMRIIDAATPLPPYKNAAITPGGQVWGPGQAGLLNPNGLSRVELWQRLSANWYLSQYLVVNHRGAEVGRIDTWTSDIYNRKRTRADKAWWTILHYTTNPIRIMRTDPLPAQVVEISNYPRILTKSNYPVSGAKTVNIANQSPSFGGMGAYTGNGFTANVSSIPNPAFWVWQEAGNPAQAGVVTASATFAINNAMIGGSSVTILPMMKALSDLPSSYVGDRNNFPLSFVRANDIYPQSILALTITLPSSQKILLGDAGPFGGELTLTTFTRNWRLDLRNLLRDSGTYKVELWASTPVTEVTGVEPGVAVFSSNPGWEKIKLPVETIEVRFNVAASNLRVVTQ